jgi:methionine synthase I (cobalamin-dependent)
MSGWSEWLLSPPLLADGPVEGWLRQRGLLVPAAGAAGELIPESLNLERPDLVSAGHIAFRHAGAQLHRTNTRAANAPDLAAHGLAGRTEAANNSAAAALRQAIGAEAIAAGCIGPVRHPAATEAERQQAYGAQAVYLSDTGADLLILEAFAEAGETARAVRAATDVHGAPVLALLAVAAVDSLAGETPRDAGQRLLDAGAESLGLIGGGTELERAALRGGLASWRELGVPLALFLDAADSGTPEAWADALAEFAGRGLAIVGGGAGALPAHIRAAAKRLGRASAG